MKRLILRIVTVVVLVSGAASILLAILFCFLGLPAFSSTVAGTTSLLLSQSAEEAEQLEAHFVMAAMGVALLNFGILSAIQGAMGIHGLRTGRFGKFIFTSGVVAFSSLFELVSGIGDEVFSSAIIALNLVFAALAYWEQRTRGKDEASESRTQAAGEALVAAGVAGTGASMAHAGGAPAGKADADETQPDGEARA